MELFVGELVPYDLHWVVCIQTQYFIFTCSAYLEVVFELEWRATCWFIEGHTHFSTAWHAKMRLAPNEPNLSNVFCSNLQTTPNMHPKPIKHEKCCVQNNQPTNSRTKDNSIAHHIIPIRKRWHNWWKNVLKFLKWQLQGRWILKCYFFPTSPRRITRELYKIHSKPKMKP